MSDVPLIRPSELARFFELHPRTVSEWIRTGRLPAVRTPGAQFRLRAADVIAFCEREKLSVPSFARPPMRRVHMLGGTDAIARSMGAAMRGTGVKIERSDDVVMGLVVATLVLPTVIAVDAKLSDGFAERVARAFAGVAIDPRPRVVAFDVPSAAKCAAFVDAGAARTVTRARRADLARVLLEIVEAT